MSDIMYRKRDSKVVLNLISLTWLAIGFLIFLWGFTFVDENLTLAVKCLGAAMMGVTGLVMTKITVGLKWEKSIGAQSFSQSLFLVSCACFSILIINVVTMKYAKFETTPMPRSVFSVLIGTTEEVCFRGFLQTWLWAMTGWVLGSVVVSSLIFGTFHGAIYGLDLPAIIIVTGASIMLGFVYAISGRKLHITMTSHGIVNFLSFLGGR